MSSYVEDLDSALVERGEDIILRRATTDATDTVTNTDVTIRAAVSAAGQPDTLVSGITQDDFKVIISMTQINEDGWPGGGEEGAYPFNVDPALPRKGDFVIIRGMLYRVELVYPLRVGDEWVRVEMLTKGGAIA